MLLSLWDDQYRLLDFGDGRRLERFGKILLDRPCPAAEQRERANPDAWPNADARFEGRNEEKGVWAERRELPQRWIVAHGALRLELKRTDFGHLGVFPEQAENWRWIAESVDRATRPLKVLNLFGYTGGSTMAAAGGGAEVVHIDAAKNVVAWARRNAELSGLGAAPIRWIAEDATKFVRREIKRGNRYDAVILDPPSYGHGPRGEVWRLSTHLPQLLSLCGELTAGQPEFVLLTCHTPGHGPEQLRETMREQCGFLRSGRTEARPLSIPAADGRQLPCGAVLRWKSGA